MQVHIEMNPINKIIRDHGIDPRGRVQLFLTNTINRRIGRYMPHLTGTLETKQKYVSSPTTIEVVSPAAKYLYYGKVMVDSKTHKGPANIPNVGFRFRKGAKLVPTARNLEYTKTFNHLAGPYWDRRLMAAEQNIIAQEVEAYIRRFG